jgi:prolyl 4-hydroxylase
MEESLSLPKKFDPNNDPQKLAKIGAHVTNRLEANKNIHKIENDEVQLYVHLDFLNQRECELLINKIDTDAQPSTLYKGTEQAGFRTSFSCNLSRWDPEVERIEKRMSAVLGIQNDFAETMQGQRYAVGQEFKAHHDFFHPSQDYWLKEGPTGGQRSWTAMIFLNLPEDGGATEFPKIGVGIRPMPGMMLIWNNVKPDGTLNYSTLHAGTPVISGVKYIITKWYRQHNWLTLNTPDG